MGDYFQSIVDVEATEDEAEDLADTLLAWLVEVGELSSPDDATRNEIRTEGLVVFTRRRVYYSLTGEFRVTCPHCRWSADDDWDALTDAIGTWYDGGPGEVTCLSCRRGAGLNDWRWSPPWGFGCLGFEFWGWPAFTPPFLSAFGVLLGHRTVYPYGKL